MVKMSGKQLQHCGPKPGCELRPPFGGDVNGHVEIGDPMSYEGTCTCHSGGISEWNGFWALCEPVHDGEQEYDTS